MPPGTKDTLARAVVWMATLVVVGVAGGCAPEVPANPTFEEHVRPILEARCLRCHSNPLGKELVPGVPPEEIPSPMYSYDYRTEAELHQARDDMAVDFLVGAYNYVNGTAVPRMPLAPAAPLEPWQIETLERWGRTFQP
jgi:hypothetical protein